MNKVSGTLQDFSLLTEDASRIIIGYGLSQVDEELYEWYDVYIYKTEANAISFDALKKAVTADINARTDEKILSGFVWNGKPVWLSSENQFNYKAAYDLAAQTEGASLPVKFKLGEDGNGEPVYHTFQSLNAFTDFYTKAIAYINQCLNEGWAEKDGIDWHPYEDLFGPAEPEPEPEEESEETPADEPSDEPKEEEA